MVYLHGKSSPDEPPHFFLQENDATELAKTYSGPGRAILVDIGTGDNFLEVQLRPEAFQAACKGNEKLSLDLRMQARFALVRIFSLARAKKNSHTRRQI